MQLQHQKVSYRGLLDDKLAGILGASMRHLPGDANNDTAIGKFSIRPDTLE